MNVQTGDLAYIVSGCPSCNIGKVVIVGARAFAEEDAMTEACWYVTSRVPLLGIYGGLASRVADSCLRRIGGTSHALSAANEEQLDKPVAA